MTTSKTNIEINQLDPKALYFDKKIGSMNGRPIYQHIYDRTHNVLREYQGVCQQNEIAQQPPGSLVLPPGLLYTIVC